jgi:hypothetical protein
VRWLHWADRWAPRLTMKTSEPAGETWQFSDQEALEMYEALVAIEGLLSPWCVSQMLHGPRDEEAPFEARRIARKALGWV